MAEVRKRYFSLRSNFHVSITFKLWTQRITAGAESHGISYTQFAEGLHQNNIQLNRKVLSELAVWEPSTFEALAKIGEQLEANNKKEK